jgi:hypothetical protein
VIAASDTGFATAVARGAERCATALGMDTSVPLIQRTKPWIARTYPAPSFGLFPVAWLYGSAPCSPPCLLRSAITRLEHRHLIDACSGEGRPPFPSRRLPANSLWEVSITKEASEASDPPRFSIPLDFGNRESFV